MAGQDNVIPGTAPVPVTGPVTSQTVSTQGGDLLGRARQLQDLGEPDVDTFYECVELATAAKRLRKAAVEFCADVKKKTDEAHKAAVAQEKALIAPIDDARDIFDKLMKRRRALDLIAANQGQAQLTTDNHEALQAARDADVAQLRAAGQEDAANDLDAQPLGVGRSVDTRTAVSSAPGLGVRKKFTAKIIDRDRALTAIAMSADWRPMFLSIDQSALDDAMQRTKGSLKIPGVVPVEDEIFVNRR